MQARFAGLAGWGVLLAATLCHASVSLPMSFVEERGRYVALGPGYRVALDRREVDVTAGGHRLLMRFAGTHPSRVEPLEPLSAAASFYIGSDPRQWRTGVNLY